MEDANVFVAILQQLYKIHSDLQILVNYAQEGAKKLQELEEVMKRPELEGTINGQIKLL